MSVAAELEFESELAMENEQELAGELEQEFELAQEITHELELEHEQEAEHEMFFNHLAAMGDRGGQSQALRRIALAAARQALKAQNVKPWPVIEGEMESEGELGEHEFETGLSPVQTAQLAAMMEHEGHAAAESANEQEAAEHFLPLIGLAAKFVLPKLVGFAAKKLGGKLLGKVGGKLISKVGGKLISKVGGNLLRRVGPRIIKQVTPQLTRGIANVTRTLFRNPSTRPLIHAVPRIARTTVARLGQQIARGRRITPQTAARVLAQQTARTLSNPRALAQTYRRSLALDRRYHHRTRRVLGRPTGAPVRAAFPNYSPSPGSYVSGPAPIPGTPPTPGTVTPIVTPYFPAGTPAATPAAPAAHGCRCAVTPTCPTCGR